MKRLVSWLAVGIICCCVSVAQADDAAKAADAQARRESVVAQRRALRAQFQIDKGAQRRERLAARKVPPTFYWWVEYLPSRHYYY